MRPFVKDDGLAWDFLTLAKIMMGTFTNEGTHLFAERMIEEKKGNPSSDPDAAAHQTLEDFQVDMMNENEKQGTCTPSSHSSLPALELVTGRPTRRTDPRARARVMEVPTPRG